MPKCKWCGKEITRTDRIKFCSPECGRKANAETTHLSNKINTIAKKYNLEVKNKDKIIRAKMMLFAGGDLKRCPCDAQNPNRYCGSLQCLADIWNDGHCHCNLFHLKKKPLLKDDDEIK